MSARHRRTSSEGAAAGAAAPHHIAPVPLLGIDHAHEDMVSLVDRRSDYYRRSALAEHLQHENEQRAQTAAAGAKRVGRRGGASQPGPPPSSSPASEPLLTLPNVLTLTRLVFVPVVGLLWYGEHPSHPLAAALLFVAASLTDWLDGYLARRLELTSAFGAFLDPVADKVMVSTALVLLATTPPAPLLPKDLAAPVVVIIAREITISALREWAASLGGGTAGVGGGGGMRAAVKVNSLGKWKTALQMAAMSALMLGRDRSGAFQRFLDGAARAVGVRPCAAAAGGGGKTAGVPVGGGASGAAGGAGGGGTFIGGGGKEGFTSTLARAFGSMAPPPAPAAIPTAAPCCGGGFFASLPVPCLRRAFTSEAVVLGAWVALWGAAMLAVWSGAVYFRAAWGAFFDTVAHPAPAPAAEGAAGAGHSSPGRAPRLAVPDTPLTDGPAAAAGSPRTPLRRSTRR